MSPKRKKKPLVLAARRELLENGVDSHGIACYRGGPITYWVNDRKVSKATFDAALEIWKADQHERVAR